RLMKQIVLASTSTLFGESYLSYLQAVIIDLFARTEEVIFIPYARPGGISHDEYTGKAEEFFKTIGKSLRGLHTFPNPQEALRSAKGIFTGGGNTFLLVKALHELNLMDALREVVEQGAPYLGCSAGSNIGGLNMQTTNDMPIVYPPCFRSLTWVPSNLNQHYLNPDPQSTHNGETRETRIKEFHTQNSIPVVGLREGNWLRINGEQITTEGSRLTRIFEAGKEPYEIKPRSSIKFYTI